ALPCPALPVALPCWLRATLPCPSRRPAGRAPPSHARRAALLAPRHPALPARRPAGRSIALPCPRATLLVAASPCPARAPPCWPPHRPALPARRPAGSRPALPYPRAALLAAALPFPALPARHPAGRRLALPVAPPCPSHSPPHLALRASLALAHRPARRAVLACGRPIQFDTWLDNLQLYLLSNSRDGVSLFGLMSGASLAPPDTADSATRSQWLTHDTAARLAVRNHLLLAERAHFGQHKTAKALYDAVVARYSSPATTALDRLILP
ncbi:unnamed protein product, partial [Closterium sp. NIES-53]